MATINSKRIYKSQFFLKFYVLRERSSLVALFVECPVCSNFKMHSFLILFLLFQFATFNRKCVCKSHLFLKFEVLRKGSSFIAFFVEHSVCSNFKMYSVLALVFYFNWLHLIQSSSAQVYFS